MPQGDSRQAVISLPIDEEAVLERFESVERLSELFVITAYVICPGGQVDFERCEVRFRDGECTALSERECEILRYIAANPGRVIARDEIISRVWRLNPRGIETRAIDMHIARLRAKLRDDPDRPRLLTTVRGKGYMFSTPNGE